MISLREFRSMASRMVDRIPPVLLRELNGGILVLEEAKPHGPDLPDVYILGEYIEDPYGLGSHVVLYYGSFVRLFGDAPKSEWEAELWETITHELRHHLESLAGVGDLDLEDLRRLEQLRREQGPQAGRAGRG